MPQNHRYSQKLGRWIKKSKTQAYDYDDINGKSAGFIVSFYRFYPDYFLDLIRSPNATYSLELPQRLMLRMYARYRNIYITGCRGLTKTYIILLSGMLNGLFYPNEIIRYTAPNQKQAATLASQTFKQIEKDYPTLAMCWKVTNNRGDLFKIQTDYGSEFTMYAPRGDNCSQTIAEEIGQEGEFGFDMEKYEKDVLPTCRLTRKVNQKLDENHINLRHTHISNACSRLNPAYTKHRASVVNAMLYGEEYDGIACDISWTTALLCNLRDIEYIKDQKAKLSVEDWMREMCAIYIGTNENPIVSDEVLARSRTLKVMENRHCGNKDAIYIISHDVSYENSARNAKCGDVVLKLTRYTDNIEKKDKYKKQVVYVDGYPPQPTGYEQAMKVKELWQRFCIDGGQTTYIVIDTRAYGKEIVEELMKPPINNEPALCCYKHMMYTELEQPNALPVIYPLKATSSRGGGTDNEGDMLRYAQVEFEQGGVELLTNEMSKGIEQYKLNHFIKDDFGDSKIALPYKKTDELCQQIQNLIMKVSGTSPKEERKSKTLQRDIWSALKYALRMSALLESELSLKNNKSTSSWQAEINKYTNGLNSYRVGKQSYNTSNRNDLLRLRNGR